MTVDHDQIDKLHQHVPTVLKPRPWGFFGSIGWLILATLISIASIIVAVLLLDPQIARQAGTLTSREFELRLLPYTVIFGYGALLALLALAARLRHWSMKDYFGLVLPGFRETVLGLAALAVMLAAEHGVVYLTDWNTDYVTDTYAGAHAAGVPSVVWVTFSLIIAAPVAEEMVFRGFLYRGWADRRFGVIPVILVISALFALIHIQYDWLGMFLVFCSGLLYGWARWRSGSTLLAILLHAANNIWVTGMTVAEMEWPT
jgi:membrane protease YdiL (CAAX protease family)